MNYVWHIYFLLATNVLKSLLQLVNLTDMDRVAITNNSHELRLLRDQQVRHIEHFYLNHESGRVNVYYSLSNIKRWTKDVLQEIEFKIVCDS